MNETTNPATWIISIFAEYTEILKINPAGYVVLPKGADFSMLTSDIIFDQEKTGGSESVATINYYLDKQLVGSTTLDVVEQKTEGRFEFGPSKTTETKEEKEENKKLRIDVRIIFAALIGIFFLFIIFKYLRYRKKQGRSRRQIRRQRHGRSMRSTRHSHRSESRLRYKTNIHRRHRHRR